MVGRNVCINKKSTNYYKRPKENAFLYLLSPGHTYRFARYNQTIPQSHVRIVVPFVTITPAFRTGSTPFDTRTIPAKLLFAILYTSMLPVLVRFIEFGVPTTTNEFLALPTGLSSGGENPSEIQPSCSPTMPKWTDVRLMFQWMPTLRGSTVHSRRTDYCAWLA